MSSIAQRIKIHNSYTPADGKDLGIDTVTTTIDTETIQPAISVHIVEAGKPEIVWKKKGMAAIELYVDRGNGFEFLALDMSPNYIDDTYTLDAGQTAIWKYKGVYLLKDKRVGQFSEIISITVTGQEA